MPKVTIVGQREFQVESGTNLLKFLQDAHYDQSLPATCGGRGSCSTCAVRLLKGGGPPNASEKDLLKDRLAKKWRLSCQVAVTEDLEIEVPGYEAAESLDIAPALVQDILDYAAEELPLRQIPSPQRITVRRLKEMRNRAEAIVDGGGDPQDFQILRSLLSYALAHDRIKEVPSKQPFTEKTVGLMLQVFAKRIPEEQPEEEVLTYPYFLYVIVAIFFFLTAGLSIYSVLVNAPLEEPATPSFTPNPEKAPWYFLGIQELLADSPNLGGFLTSVALGGVILPGLFVLFLFFLPYIEPYLEFWRRDRSRPPGRRLRDRPMAVTLFTLAILLFLFLIIIGTYFRGPQWQLVLPWQ
jgi:ferredoxin